LRKKWTAFVILLSAENATARTDVFGLGGSLFHLLTGRPPNRGKKLRETLMRVATVKVPPVSEVRKARNLGPLPEALTDLVDSCTQQNYKCRPFLPQMQRELQAALDKL